MTQLAASLGYLLGAVVVGVILYLLRRILREAVKSGPFQASNVSRMRLIGYVILGVGILAPVIQYLVSALALRGITAADPAVSAPLAFDPTVILSGLLFLVLAHIWSYGLDIEQDRALVI
jgi:hypothetical protein